MTFTNWIYKWFMRGHDSPPGTERFTRPSSQLFLRSTDMLISKAPSSSACCSLPQNWVTDFSWLFILRFEWHSLKFFQLLWSNLYLLLFPETWQRGEVLEVLQQKRDRLHSTFIHARWKSCFFFLFKPSSLHPLVGHSWIIYYLCSPLKPKLTIRTRR